MKSRNSDADKRLIMAIFYEGPWDKLSGFFLGVRKDFTLRWDIPLNPKGWRWALGKLAHWCERRDRAWQNTYIRSGKVPHKRWMRR